MQTMNPQIRRAPAAGGNLYDVLDLILDKGIVIDAFVRVSLVGIELLTVDLRVVIASVDTYLRYAEGVEKLNMFNPERSKKLGDVVSGGGSAMAMKKGAKKLKEKITGGGDEDDDQGNDDDDDTSDENEGVGEKLAHGVRHVLRSGVGRIMERLSGEEREDDDDKDDGDEDDRGSRHSGQSAKQGSKRDNGKPDDPDRGRKFHRTHERFAESSGGGKKDRSKRHR